MGLVDDVLEAHGGRERWAAARTVRARVRSGGLLLGTRVAGDWLSEGRLEVGVDRVWAAAESIAEPGLRGVFADGAVRVEEGGEVRGSRTQPRDCFFGSAGLRRNLRWDRLDATYFAGYAWWNYINVPYLFLRDGVEAVEGEPLMSGEGTWRRLDVSFPPGLDTHCPRQSFFYDEELRLRRHDYTAEVVGGWARAAHACAGHVEAGGLVFPTRRRVTPRGPGGRVLPGPALVWLELSEIEVE